ncbi:hypothetical protein TUN199_07531 [Pyrenophora tritici-repentis]|nr:hypothetical protein TUN199_07531 [Pyrenophora tritici-repentis]
MGGLLGFGEFDLAQLVKMCWDRRDQKCIFRLISPSDAEQDEQTGDLTKLLNTTLRHLVTDTFGIRQYRRQILSISMDHVDGDLPSQVCIKFGDSHRHSDANWKLNFQSKDKCKTFERFGKDQRPALVCLPRGVKKLIFKEVMCSDPVDVNVDDMDLTSPDLSLLFVCKQITNIAKPILWSQNDFTYRTTLEPSPVDRGTSQRRLQAVLGTRKTMVHSYSDRFCPNTSRHVSRGTHQNITIEFNFEYDRAMTLADVRIDAKHLIRIASHLDGRKCFVRFKVSSTVDGVTKTEENTVTLRDIRARILELLSHAVSTNRRIANGDVFEFDIDGNGNVGRLKYTIMLDSESILGTEEYVQLPSIEAVEAHHGREYWEGKNRPMVDGDSSPHSIGKLSTYFRYLQAVAKRSSNMMMSSSDDYFARKCFFEQN